MQAAGCKVTSGASSYCLMLVDVVNCSAGGVPIVTGSIDEIFKRMEGS